MHIFFSAIGGTGIGPLALIAKQAGYTVSGSDKQDSLYIQYLRSQGLNDIHIGQTKSQIQKIHEKNPIDWYVYSSAVTMEQAKPEELSFVQSQKIQYSKRDGLLNQILLDKKLKLIAIAGTHGKSTTTAMVIWLFKELGIPLSYSVGAKLSFGDMGTFDPKSQYFAYECDEFDRNFLAFEPYISAITGVSWDHHEIFPTREDYQEAFREFISQSDHTICWQEDFDYLGLQSAKQMTVLESDHPHIQTIKLAGLYNRLDAWIAVNAVHEATRVPVKELLSLASSFPGLQRRMEKIAKNLYTDYAHTPEKIIGCMSVALEMAEVSNQNVIVIYEPLTNRRQHFMRKDYKDCFNGATHVYWVHSYLAREDPLQEILSPTELIKDLADPTIATPMNRDDELKKTIEKHLAAGDLVVAMSGGGGGGLDDWLRHTFNS
ncbi:MAG: Mur ligase domain-containing protein [Candidatus Saccharibacteria bacterium]|nr:Mur ligase domain-containing protein [Candidatus Saccharibacteria bacterium]